MQTPPYPCKRTSLTGSGLPSHTTLLRNWPPKQLQEVTKEERAKEGQQGQAKKGTAAGEGRRPYPFGPFATRKQKEKPAQVESQEEEEVGVASRPFKLVPAEEVQRGTRSPPNL
eukprot:4183673-Amphidinium_carterae.1